MRRLMQNEFADALASLLRSVPLKQWDVARELRRRIKARLDPEGIRMPYPQRVILTRPAA